MKLVYIDSTKKEISLWEDRERRSLFNYAGELDRETVLDLLQSEAEDSLTGDI